MSAYAIMLGTFGDTLIEQEACLYSIDMCTFNYSEDEIKDKKDDLTF